VSVILAFTDSLFTEEFTLMSNRVDVDHLLIDSCVWANVCGQDIYDGRPKSARHG
jgi:hypothetical protein